MIKTHIVGSFGAMMAVTLGCVAMAEIDPFRSALIGVVTFAAYWATLGWYRVGVALKRGPVIITLTTGAAGAGAARAGAARAGAARAGAAGAGAAGAARPFAESDAQILMDAIQAHRDNPGPKGGHQSPMCCPPVMKRRWADQNIRVG
jgi:hypothetical protein